MNIIQSQVVGMFKENDGDSREIHLGCIRIDPPNLSRPVGDKKFAFYAFRAGLYSADNRISHCSISDKFLVISGSEDPESRSNQDVLFFFKDDIVRGKTKDNKRFVWKVLKPSGNNCSSTAVIVHGEEALNRLLLLVKAEAGKAR